MSAQSLSSRAILGRIYLRITMGAIGWIDQLSFPIESDQAQEEHKWLGMNPTMREWIGGRNVHGLRDQGFIITNKPYESTLAVPLTDIRRDKTGQVMARANSLGNAFSRHGAGLLSTLILDGETKDCYDGQFFFDTDHSEHESGNQSNDISVDISALPTSQHGSVTAPAVEEMQQVILQGIQQMLGFKDDRGEPMNENANSFMVMVPVPLWTTAVAAVTMKQLSGGQSNILSQMAAFNIAVQANPRLTWTDKIVIFRVASDDGVKPFIRQSEKPLSVKSQAEGSAEEFYNDRWVFGLDYNGNVGYGFWQHAVLVLMI